MGTIISKLYTPYDEDNQRDVIHHETQIDAVLDPVEGIPLRQRLQRIDGQLVLVDTSEDNPHNGLISPEMARKFDKALTNGIVVSKAKPSSGSTSLWLRTYDDSLTTVEPI